MVRLSFFWIFEMELWIEHWIELIQMEMKKAHEPINFHAEQIDGVTLKIDSHTRKHKRRRRRDRAKKMTNNLKSTTMPYCEHTHKHAKLATICQRNVNAIRVYLAAAAIIASECKNFCSNRIETKQTTIRERRQRPRERRKEIKNALRLIHHGMMTPTINVQQKFSDWHVK